jgi:AAA domain
VTGLYIPTTIHEEPIAVAVNGSQQTGHRSIHLTAVSSIDVRPVKWLWDNRLPLGTLGLLGGREGIGKSIVAYTLAGLLTRARSICL